jgi:hypothetical protein
MSEGERKSLNGSDKYWRLQWAIGRADNRERNLLAAEKGMVK